MMYNEDPEDDEEQDELRRQLGDRYDIQEMIGRGACGVVYKAFDREEARVVALKRMHYHDIDVNGIPPHIIREVTALRSLTHTANENIVSLYDFKTHTSTFNAHLRESFTFVLEYIDEDLERYLVKQEAERLSREQIKNFMQQLLRGVTVIHNLGLIHRDIKPQNILISNTGQLKISDFGLARMFRPGKALTTQVVTQWYRAPEVLLDAPYNRAIDIWSVGCIFGELHTLRALFPGRSERQQLDLIFRVVGTPLLEDWPPCSIQWRSFGCYPPTPFQYVMPHAIPEALDLIAKLLKFKESARPMATEALEHDFFKSSSLSQGSGSPGGRGSHHGDEFPSNPLHQVEGDPAPHAASRPSLEKGGEGSTTKEEERQRLLLEASQDSGVGTQLDPENEDIEDSQEVEKHSICSDSLLADPAELDLFECREPEEWGWDLKENTATKPPVGQEGVVSSVNPPAKRVKYENT